MAATLGPVQDPRMSLRNILHDGDAILDISSSSSVAVAGSIPNSSMYDEKTPRTAYIGGGLIYSPPQASTCYRRPSTAGSIASVSMASSPSASMDESPCEGTWQIRTSNNTYPSNGMERKPRAPRPSYSEEQKFFIMFARVLLDQSWPQIEDGFSRIFNDRTKGGLTSIYYRVRKDWGLCEVLKSGPHTAVEDQDAVRKRASNFSTEFLTQIGWFAPATRS